MKLIVITYWSICIYIIGQDVKEILPYLHTTQGEKRDACAVTLALLPHMNVNRNCRIFGLPIIDVSVCKYGIGQERSVR